MDGTLKKRPAEASRFYFFLQDPNVGCQPAVLPFWLGAAAIVFIFSFFVFLDSRLPDSYARLKATSIKFACDGQDEMSTAFDEAVAQLENIHRSPVKMVRQSHQQIHLTSTHICIGHSRGLPSRTPDVWK